MKRRIRQPLTLLDGRPKRALVSLLLLGVSSSLGPSTLLAEEASGKDRVTYDDHIAPLFREKCFSCHNQEKKKSGLALNTFSLTLAGGSSGAIIKPGDPDASRLYVLVTHQEKPHMPPRGGKLPDASITTIRKWIEAGAPENRGSKVKLPEKPKLDLAVKVDPGAKPTGPPPVPRAFSLETRAHTARGTAVTAIAANPWSPVIALSGQKQILLYDSETAQLLGILPFPEGAVQVLKFSRNGALLLAGGGRAAHSGRVVVWDVRSGDRVVEVGDELDSVLAADISSDHNFIALSGPSKLVRIYSTADGELLHSIKKHTDWVYTLEFSPDGVLLASGDRSGGLHVWESFSGREYLTLRGHGGAVTDVSWRLDSNILASSSEDSTVRLWEMENGAQVRRWNGHGGGTLGVEFAKDGRLVTCGRDRRTKLWQQDGKQLHAFETFSDLALEVTIDHTGARVIAGDWSGTVRVWNSADGKRTATLSSNPEPLGGRLARAQEAHTAANAAASRFNVELDALRAAAKTATEELTTAKATLDQAAAERKEAAAAVGKTRSEATNAAQQLQARLADLTARESELEKLFDAETPDAEAIKKSTAELENVRQSTRSLTDELSKSMVSRLSAQDSLLSVLARQRDANTLVAGKEPAANQAAEELRKKEESGAPLMTALTRARSAVDKWTAAVEIDKTLKSIEKLQAELRAREIVVAERTAAKDAATAKLSELAKALEVASLAAQAIVAESEKAAAGLLAKSKASTEQSNKVIEAMRALADGAAADDDSVARAREQLAAMQKSSEDLAGAVVEATKKWSEHRKKADAGATAAAKALEEFEKQLAAVRKTTQEIAAAKKQSDATRTNLDNTRRTREEWGKKFETARKATSGTKDVLAKS